MPGHVSLQYLPNCYYIAILDVLDLLRSAISCTKLAKNKYYKILFPSEIVKISKTAEKHLSQFSVSFGFSSNPNVQSCKVKTNHKFLIIKKL